MDVVESGRKVTTESELKQELTGNVLHVVLCPLATNLGHCRLRIVKISLE